MNLKKKLFCKKVKKKNLNSDVLINSYKYKL